VRFHTPRAPILQDTNAADALLYFCKRLWGQSIVGAIFALLLHRWLLLRPEAGGIEQRQKHVHVLMLGAWLSHRAVCLSSSVLSLQEVFT
jgi:hypothetical protein